MKNRLWVITIGKRNLKKSLCVLAVLLFTVSSGIGATLVGHWKFDGDLSDETGSNDALISPANAANNPTIGTADGVNGGAATFDGDNDCISLPNATTLIPDNTFSISFWEYSSTTASPADGYIIASGNGGGYEALWFRRLAASSVYYQGEMGSAISINAVYTAPARGAWHHVVLTYDGSVAQEWADKVKLVDSNKVVNVAGLVGSTITLGNRPDLGRDLDGKIDDVQIYDAALGIADIKQLYEVPGGSLDDVIYREIFPNDNGVNASMASEGWEVRYTTNGFGTAGVVIQNVAATTAFSLDETPVNSNPQDTGATAGYVNNMGTDSSYTPYLYWTEELSSVLPADQYLDVADIHAIHFDTRNDTTAYTNRVAIRIGDDWFVSADFDNPAGTSAFTHPNPTYWATRVLFFDKAEWTTLDFVPSEALVMGTTEVSLPAGHVTGFGVYVDTELPSQRTDNFTVVGKLSTYPKGTTILLR